MISHKFSEVVNELSHKIKWSDIKLQPEQTIIRDVHIYELRQAIENIHYFLEEVCPWKNPPCGVRELYGEITDPANDIGIDSPEGMISVVQLDDAPGSYQIRCVTLHDALDGARECGVRELISEGYIDTGIINQDFGYWSLGCGELQDQIKMAIPCGIASADLGSFNGVFVDQTLGVKTSAECLALHCAADTSCQINECPIDECPMDGFNHTWDEVFKYSRQGVKDRLTITCPDNLTLYGPDPFPLYGRYSVYTDMKLVPSGQNDSILGLFEDPDGIYRHRTAYTQLVNDREQGNDVDENGRKKIGYSRYYGTNNIAWMIDGGYEPSPDEYELDENGEQRLKDIRRGYWKPWEGVVRAAMSLKLEDIIFRLDGDDNDDFSGMSVFNSCAEYNYYQRGCPQDTQMDGPGPLIMYGNSLLRKRGYYYPTENFIIGSKSIVNVGKRGYRLMNDVPNGELEPKMYYGTDYHGKKGFHKVTNGLLQASKSVTQAENVFFLVNDESSPGSNKYYGTNEEGIRGYYDLPKCGIGGGTGGVITTSTLTTSNVKLTGISGKALASVSPNSLMSSNISGKSVVLSDTCSIAFLN